MCSFLCFCTFKFKLFVFMSIVVLHCRGSGGLADWAGRPIIYYLPGFGSEVFGVTMCLTPAWPARGQLLYRDWIFSGTALWVHDRYFKHAMPLQVRRTRWQVKYVCIYVYIVHMCMRAPPPPLIKLAIMRLQFCALNLSNSIAMITNSIKIWLCVWGTNGLSMLNVFNQPFRPTIVLIIFHKSTCTHADLKPQENLETSAQPYLDVCLTCCFYKHIIDELREVPKVYLLRSSSAEQQW